MFAIVSIKISTLTESHKTTEKIDGKSKHK